MTGAELAAIRRTLYGTNTAAFGAALGLGGNDASRAASVRRLETMERIPGWFEKLATIYEEIPGLPDTLI